MSATARRGVTRSARPRMSATMISLPMPFILAKAWLASALMKFPNFCLSYMANRLASIAELSQGMHMTHLSWDERRRSRVRNGTFGGRGGTLRRGLGVDWRSTWNEPYPLLSASALVALIPAAIIDAGPRPVARAHGLQPAPSPIGLCPPRSVGGAGCPRRPTPRPAGGTPSPAAQTPAPAPRPRRPPPAGADRRPLRRGVHARAQEGGGHQGHRQLGRRPSTP